MRGLELRKGTVDLVVNDLAPDVIWQLRAEGRLQVTSAAGTDYAYIGLNQRDPVLRNLDVRKAIGFAIDREAIVKYLRRGFATVAVGIVPPMSWAFERNVFDFRHDPAEARRLLDAAGFPDPDGDGPLPRFRLSLKTSTSEVYRVQAAAIQQDLARVGIAVDVRSSELLTLLSDAARGNFQLYTLQWVGVTDPDMLRRVYHSKQAPPSGLNRVFYQNAEVDRLIDACGGRRIGRRAQGALFRGAAVDRAGCAVHQPLGQGERCSRAGRPAGRSSVAHGRLHLPQGRHARDAAIGRARMSPGGRRDGIRRRSDAARSARRPGLIVGLTLLVVFAAAPARRCLAIRPTASIPHDRDTTVRHPLSPGRGGSCAPARAGSRGCRDDARSDARAGIRARARCAGEPERPAKRVGHARALQPDRDQRRRTRRREHDRERRRLAAAGLHTRVHAHRSPGPISWMDRRPPAGVRAKPGALPQSGVAAVGDRRHCNVRGERADRAGPRECRGLSPDSRARSIGVQIRADRSRRWWTRRLARRQRAVCVRRVVRSLPRRSVRGGHAAAPHRRDWQTAALPRSASLSTSVRQIARRTVVGLRRRDASAPNRPSLRSRAGSRITGSRYPDRGSRAMVEFTTRPSILTVFRR